MKIREFTQAPDKKKGSKPWSKKRSYKYFVKSKYDFIDTSLKVDRKLLQGTGATQKYFILLSDQTVLIGAEFDIMRAWKSHYRGKQIEEMAPTNTNMQGISEIGGKVVITNLSKFIEQN